MLHSDDYDFEKYLAMGTIKAMTKHTIDKAKTRVKFSLNEYEFKNSHIRYLVSSNISCLIVRFGRFNDVANIKYSRDCKVYDIGDV